MPRHHPTATYLQGNAVVVKALGYGVGVVGTRAVGVGGVGYAEVDFGIEGVASEGVELLASIEVRVELISKPFCPPAPEPGPKYCLVASSIMDWRFCSSGAEGWRAVGGRGRWGRR